MKEQLDIAKTELIEKEIAHLKEQLEKNVQISSTEQADVLLNNSIVELNQQIDDMKEVIKQNEHRIIQQEQNLLNADKEIKLTNERCLELSKSLEIALTDSIKNRQETNDLHKNIEEKEKQSSIDAEKYTNLVDQFVKLEQEKQTVKQQLEISNSRETKASEQIENGRVENRKLYEQIDEIKKELYEKVQRLEAAEDVTAKMIAESHHKIEKTGDEANYECIQILTVII